MHGTKGLNRYTMCEPLLTTGMKSEVTTVKVVQFNLRDRHPPLIKKGKTYGRTKLYSY